MDRSPKLPRFQRVTCSSKRFSRPWYGLCSSIWLDEAKLFSSFDLLCLK